MPLDQYEILKSHHAKFKKAKQQERPLACFILSDFDPKNKKPKALKQAVSQEYRKLAREVVHPDKAPQVKNNAELLTRVQADYPHEFTNVTDVAQQESIAQAIINHLADEAFKNLAWAKGAIDAHPQYYLNTPPGNNSVEEDEEHSPQEQFFRRPDNNALVLEEERNNYFNLLVILHILLNMQRSMPEDIGSYLNAETITLLNDQQNRRCFKNHLDLQMRQYMANKKQKYPFEHLDNSALEKECFQAYWCAETFPSALKAYAHVSCAKQFLLPVTVTDLANRGDLIAKNYYREHSSLVSKYVLPGVAIGAAVGAVAGGAACLALGCMGSAFLGSALLKPATFICAGIGAAVGGLIGGIIAGICWLNKNFNISLSKRRIKAFDKRDHGVDETSYQFLAKYMDSVFTSSKAFDERDRGVDKTFYPETEKRAITASLSHETPVPKR